MFGPKPRMLHFPGSSIDTVEAKRLEHGNGDVFT